MTTVIRRLAIQTIKGLPCLIRNSNTLDWTTGRGKGRGVAQIRAKKSGFFLLTRGKESSKKLGHILADGRVGIISSFLTVF